MPTPLTAAQVREYGSSGFLHPIGVLDAREVARYRRGYEQVAAMLGGAPRAVEMSQIHRFYAWAWELARHTSVLDAVEAVLGPDILLWSCQVFPKQAHDPGFVTMHQDGTYWGLEGGEVTTAWVALSPSTRKSGCMRLVPASHRASILPHQDTFARDNLLTRGQEVQAEFDEAEVVDLELQPGEMSLHHVRAIHGSHRNRSDHPRIGFVSRYMTPEVRPLRPGQAAVLVRGEDRCGNWDLLQAPPDYPTLEAAVLAHRAEADRWVAELTRD